MIGQIAKKEIHHNFYSIRFLALLVISSVLFISDAILAVTEPAQDISRPEPSTHYTKAIRQHNTLQFCVRDASVDRVREIYMWIGGSINPRMRTSSAEVPVGDRLGRYALPHADRIDWMFTIKIIFSLFAIIFTFDAVCRERENGTLTFMCANSVSRSSVLLGKYLGACGTLLIPLTVGVVLNLLIIVSGIGRTVPLETEHWLRIGLLIVTSMVYISLFAFLGLLASTAMQRSSSSLLILLAFWVALIIAHPNVSVIVAKSASEIETKYQLRQKVWAVQREGRDEFNRRLRNSKIETQEDYRRLAEEAFSKREKIMNDMESSHRNAVVKRRRLARRIAMVSPAAVYQFAGEAIADSGFERQQRFLKSARNYYLVYENYVRKKVGKIYHTGRSNYVMSRTVDGKTVRFYTQPEEYEGDMSDFTYFKEPEWSIIDSLRVSFTNLFILFLWNILLFIAAHCIFVKRSLR